MEEEKGISIGDIFKTIFLCKWLALIIAAVITIAGTLALYCGYNSASEDYKRTFTVSFPGNENVNPVYPDNTPFVYLDMISLANLEEVKASDQRFSYIDAQKMYESGAVKISRSTEEVVVGQVEINYSITVKASYFNNKNDAVTFIDGLAQLPVKYVTGLAIDQDLYIRDYSSTEFYEEKASMLSKQLDYVQKAVSELYAQTAGNLKNNCARLQITLGLYKQKLDTAIGSMQENLYVHSAEAVETDYRLQVSTLEMQLENKKREADILFGRIESGDTSVDIAQLPERVEELAVEISNLETSIATYKKYISEYNGGKALTENADFANTLSGLNTEIKALTDEYESLLGQYYKVSSLIAYNGGLSTENSLSLIMCGIISLVAGIIIALIVAYIFGYIKKNKAAKSEETNAPAAEETADGQ